MALKSALLERGMRLKPPLRASKYPFLQMSTSFDDNSESFEFCREEPGDYRLKIIPTVENWGV